MFEKVSRSLKYDSNFFSSTYIYMDTTTDHFTPLALRVRGNDDICHSQSTYQFIAGHWQVFTKGEKDLMLESQSMP